jgi:hypothetical protein
VHPVHTYGAPRGAPVDAVQVPGAVLRRLVESDLGAHLVEDPRLSRALGRREAHLWGYINVFNMLL